MADKDAAPDGSIVARATPRPDFLAFEIRKKITKPDIEWMAAKVDRAFDAHDEVDMLIVMTNYDGAALGALFDGDVMKVQTRAAAHVRRYAVVGAPGWASAMIDMLGPLSPVETKTFDLSDEEIARRWAATGAA